MSDDTEADVTDRDPDIEDDEGHGITVEGGGDAGASSPEESEEIDAENPDEAEEPDEEDEMRAEEAKETENVDNHRDEEPFYS
ncbi:hypothetical protein ACFQJC_03695 [Haloferax namakaokahaiae]|uniref:Uncharacterized protein n=1 Tax=Haloferax namakaokahaiae TaxID=1748331 RepID=A0ABD5ZBQ8_9EURY